MPVESDYQYILSTTNFNGGAGKSTLPNPNSDARAEIEQDGNGFWQFYYYALSSLSDMNALGYYDTPTTDTDSNSGTVDREYDKLPAGNDPGVINANQLAILSSVLSPSAYGVSFSDVAKIDFNAGTTSTADIVFGVTTSGNGIDDITGAYAWDYNGNESLLNAPLKHGDIWLNADFVANEEDIGEWITSDKGSLPYLTIMHELGHALGLDHTFTQTGVDGQGNPIYEPILGADGQSIDNHQYSIMSYTLMDGMDVSGSNNEVLPFGLQLLDIAAIQAIYGENWDTRSENNTQYSGATAFASARLNDAFIYTIWDGGGTGDTIDATGYEIVVNGENLGATIDLRQGEFSSIGYNAEGGAAVDNLAIAYHDGVANVIEKAIGTNNDDTFRTVEGQANIIDGRDGIDTIDYSHYSSAITVDLASQSDSEGNTLISIENVILGDAGGDVAGSTGDEYIIGSIYNDIITGAGGSDTLEGLAGDDVLSIANNNQDYLTFVDGGSGFDYYQATNGDIILSGSSAIAETGTAVNIEGVLVDSINHFVHVQDLGWSFDVNQANAMSTMDYSDINQALVFDLDSTTAWTVTETQGGAPASDSYSNMSIAYLGGVHGPRMIGTNHGDTYNFGHTEVNGAIIDTGTGDDTINVEWHYWDNSVFTFNFSGGDDVINFTNLANPLTTYGLWPDHFEINLASHIKPSDVSFTKNNVSLETSYRGNGFHYDVYSFDLVIDLGAHGSISWNDAYYRHYAGWDNVFGNSDDYYEHYVPEINHIDGGYYQKDTGGPNYPGSGNLQYIGDTSYVSRTGTANSDILTNDNSGGTLQGFGGNDVLTGGSGSDTLKGGEGNDYLSGGAENDVLYGGLGTDTLNGDLGNDTLFGNQGGDFLYGGDGHDELFGENGDDYLEGGLQIDDLYGGNGDDVLIGGGGSDYLYGGAGKDQAVFSGNIADYTITIPGSIIVSDNVGSDGADTLTEIEELVFADAVYLADSLTTISTVFVGTPQVDVLTGTEYGDTISGLADDDELNGEGGDDILIGGAGDDDIDGGDGIDTVDYSNAAAGVIVSLQLSEASDDGDGGSDTLTNIENVIGSAYDDQLRGNGTNNELHGGGGDDIVYGADGTDYLYGDAGNDDLRGQSDDVDYLYGGADDDTLYGGAGDELYGGTGNDVMRGYGGTGVFDGGDGEDRIWWRNSSEGITADLDAGTATDESSNVATIVDVEHLTGSDYADTFYGDSGDNVLDGQDGNDELHGRGGADSIYGRVGDDELYGDAGDDELYGKEDDDILDGGADNDTLEGGTGNDRLIGGTGDDLLYGEADNDTLLGGDGDDVLSAGAGTDAMLGGIGDDRMYGGSGVDTFGFVENDTYVDRAYDFTYGEDKINLADLLSGFNSGTDDIDDFVAIVHTGARFDVWVDADGTGTSESMTQIGKIFTDISDTLTADDLLSNGTLVIDQAIV